MTNAQFISALKNSTIERQVEDAYNEIFKACFRGIEISYPFQCDGYFEVKSGEKAYRCIVEYKFDQDFSSKVDMARTSCQLLFYLKKFESNARPLPTICIVADNNECFIFHSNLLLKYLDFEGVDWSKAPSSASYVSPELLMALSEDESFNPFVFRVDEWFDVENLKNKILDLAENTRRLIHITEHNVDKVFNAFADRVVLEKKKISPNDLVGIFFGCICDKENYYLHPKKKNLLISPLGEFKVDSRKFDAFFSYFSNEVSPKEKLRLSAISDRLIEDTNRRRKGEFYTPTPFVDYAHKMISEALGEDWKEKFVVWDNCCGTKNLTRDYKFKELYCSTLENAELDIGSRYNPEATSFQFDFLNDPLEKLPTGLLEAFEKNKKILFFLNPPYARNSGVGNNTKVCFTPIREDMNKNKIGACAANLYCQFLWRIKNIKERYNLTNCHISIFSPTNFISTQSYKNFRIYFLNNFNFCDGIIFNAGHFSNVSASWPISFSLWESNNCSNKNEFNYSVVDNIDGEIKIIKNKILYNLDNQNDINDWIREETKGLKTYDVPNVTSAIKIKEERGTRCGKTVQNAIGYLFNIGKNIYQNSQGCCLFSTAFSGGIGLSVTTNNLFNKIFPYFAIKKLITNNWDICEDEYMVPNINHPKYNEFINDSIIYGLFNDAYSQQSSLRQIKYHDKLWDVKNEFFWMSKSEIESLADEFNNDDCYSDAHTSKDRFVYKKLQEITLTPEAQTVLDKACELVRKTFKYRVLFNEEHPEYQINNWDCGWYQIKAMLKEFMPNELKEFNALFKALADKMRPQVYELGFLRK